MDWNGNCRTTAMGVMPHRDIDEAIKLALAVDIPFWPQLPKVSFFEDMYAQASEHFPGIILDVQEQRISLNTDLFYEQLPEYLEHLDDPMYFAVTDEYSLVFSRFMERDLSSYTAIRGQMIGPISFGMKIMDENKKPIIYNDEIKGLIYEFMARKINVQCEQLKQKNPNAFMWMDEPGLEIIFGSFTGYASPIAHEDYKHFIEMIDAPVGLHLCGNPDWSFLLSQDISILSMDAFTCGRIFTRYYDEIRQFIEHGRCISWGIVPTLTEELGDMEVKALIDRLEEMWDFLASKGINKQAMLKQSMLAPARCCLVNPDRSITVEKSFDLLKQISNIVREKYSLYD